VAKIKAYFEGYPEDLVRVVGMSMNGFIRKIAEEQDAKAVRTTFLRPETATPDWLANHMVEQIAISLFQRPLEKRSINELAIRVWEEYKPDIEAWIEENKPNLAEIGFLFPDSPVELVRAIPPIQNFAKVPSPAAAPPAPPQAMSAIVCRRGRR
jgi:hypothetical protein